MTVLLLCPELLASDGGIQRILRLYLRALADAPEHHTVRVAALNDASLPLQRIRELNTGKITTVSAAGGHKLRFVRAVLQLSAGADRVVCGHVRQLPIAALAAFFRPRAKLYLIAHGIEVWRSFTALERWALLRTEQIWCVSDFTRREIALREPALASRLRVVPNALDPDFAVDPPVPPPVSGGRVILSVGRLSRADAYKGYDLLIRALPTIRATLPDVRLRLVGSGDDEARLRALAEPLGDAVEFPGRVSDAQLRAEFAGCTLFALPSTGEGFGLVFLEALAAGRPCVAVRAGAAPELVDETCGAVADPGNVDAIAAACLNVLRRSWSPEALHRRALAYSYPRFCEKLGSAW